MTRDQAPPDALPMLSLADAFRGGCQALGSLPSRPRVVWSVSAGHDFRPLVFFSDPLRTRAEAEGGLPPGGLPRPDLFLYTCLDNHGGGLHDLCEGQVVYEDRSTRIRLTSRRSLNLLRERVPWRLDSQRAHFVEDPLLRHDHDAALFEVELICLRTGYQEQVPLLYLAMENLHAWDVLLSRADLELTALVATREGLGMGGCGRSILEYLYQDGCLLQARGPRAIPRFVVTWSDYTDELFQREARRYHPRLTRLASYIPERGLANPHQIYRMGPCVMDGAPVAGVAMAGVHRLRRSWGRRFLRLA